jgi:hypothetical protein
VLGVALAQVYSLKSDSKNSARIEKNAVRSELQQHHDMDIYVPMKPSKLTRQQKNKKHLSH